MVVLGINLNTHDAGAALVKDGTILAAIHEERLSRIKMDGNPPVLSIAEVLRISNVLPADIDTIAVSDFPFGFRRSFLFFWQQNQRIWYTRFGYIRSFLTGRSFDRARLMRQVGFNQLRESWKSARETKRIIASLRSKGFNGTVEFVDHDLAHAAGAYYTSGRQESFVGIIEGSSFTNTCSFWKPDAEKGLVKVHEVPLPHSPGRYYEIVTLILGFHPKKHGGKITGLAALGEPKKLYEKVSDLLFIENGSIKVGRALFSLQDEYFARGRKLPKRFEGQSREDIAAAFQKRLEDVVVEQFRILGKKYSMKSLALSGGVCANVKLNMEISRLPGVEHIFVHPGMGDGGQALGAALTVYARHHPGFKPFFLKDVYFGPEYSDDEIESMLKREGIKYEKVSDIANRVGSLLAKNKVVGFFQGRMEYGPRALGNRTIMYPAVDPKVNDWLNKQLKRTEFMPFAPVTLAERAHDCYLDIAKAEYAMQFMTITSEVTEFMRKNMSAAVHVDNTARPQLVTRTINPVYYDAIKAYERLTGLPTVINTSFNMHEEPIVCTPHEALEAYEASKLDALAVGNFLVLRQ